MSVVVYAGCISMFIMQGVSRYLLCRVDLDLFYVGWILIHQANIFIARVDQNPPYTEPML